MKDHHRMRAWDGNEFKFMGSNYPGEDFSIRQAEQNGWEIELCIGSLDKNGVLIHEGDIVDHNHKFGAGCGIVVYSVDRYVLRQLRGDSICDEILSDPIGLGVQVVGNIHRKSEIKEAK